MDADFVLYPSIDVRIAHDFMEELTPNQRDFVFNLIVLHRTFFNMPVQEDVKFFLNSYDLVYKNCDTPESITTPEFVEDLLRTYLEDINRFKRQYGYWN